MNGWRRTVAATTAALLLGGAGAAAVAQEGPVKAEAAVDPNALLEQATETYRAGDYDEAARLFQALIEATPKQSSGYNGLGQVYRKQKRWDEAVEAYGAGVAAVPSWSRGYYMLGYCHRKAGRYAEAAGWYEKYIEREPDDPDAYYGLGESHRKGGNPSAAIQAFTAYVEKEKRPSEQKWVKRAREAIAELKAEVGDGDAVAEPESTPEVVPLEVEPPTGDVATLIAAGDEALKGRRFGDAVRSYQAAAEKDERGVEAHYKLGVALAVDGDLPGAIVAWEVVLERQPGQRDAQRNIERARRKLTELSQASIDDPRLGEGVKERLELAQSYLDAERPSMALRVLDPMAMESPEDGRVRLLRGVALMKMGRYQEAGRDLELALAYNPSDAQVFAALGQNALLLSDDSRALYFLNLFLERVDPAGRDPSFDAYRAMVDRLRARK